MGSGERIQRDFGLPNLVRFPIVPDLSAAGDGGRPLVVSDPTSSTSATYMELGAAVVREVAKMGGKNEKAARVVYDAGQHLVIVRLPGAPEFAITPATLRRNDTSATSVNEWTGARMIRDEDVAETVTPQAINPLGNYAVQVSWEDGFNQVASFELLDSLREYAVKEYKPYAPPLPTGQVQLSVGGMQVSASLS